MIADLTAAGLLISTNEAYAEGFAAALRAEVL